MGKANAMKNNEDPRAVVVHVFKTGREYGNNQQKIAWTEIDSGVLFADPVRCIDGFIEEKDLMDARVRYFGMRRDVDIYSNNTVMYCYDRSIYISDCTEITRKEYLALTDLLSRAADQK